MKKLLIVLALVLAYQPAWAACVGSRALIGTGSTHEECEDLQNLKEQERRLAIEKRRAAVRQSQNDLASIKGDQNANTGTIVNIGGGGLSAEELAAHEASPLVNESQLAIYISSAIFELSPQQPGASRQFLTSQNSGGTALGVYYKFAKGIHLVGQYEKFRYKGKEFDQRPPTTGQVQSVDEFGIPIFEDGQPVMEEVAMRDMSYTWAEEYVHTRYMIGVGFRGILSEQSGITWALDVFPMGWYETEFKHSDKPDETFGASKSYGFRGNINYHVSSDFWISGYYQLFDAQKEAAQYVDEFRPLGSQEIGVTMAFGLPNVMGLVR